MWTHQNGLCVLPMTESKGFMKYIHRKNSFPILWLSGESSFNWNKWPWIWFLHSSKAVHVLLMVIWAPSVATTALRVDRTLSHSTSIHQFAFKRNNVITMLVYGWIASYQENVSWLILKFCSNANINIPYVHGNSQERLKSKLPLTVLWSWGIFYCMIIRKKKTLRSTINEMSAFLLVCQNIQNILSLMKCILWSQGFCLQELFCDNQYSILHFIVLIHFFMNDIV